MSERIKEMERGKILHGIGLSFSPLILSPRSYFLLTAASLVYNLLYVYKIINLILLDHGDSSTVEHQNNYLVICGATPIHHILLPGVDQLADRRVVAPLVGGSSPLVGITQANAIV